MRLTPPHELASIGLLLTERRTPRRANESNRTKLFAAAPKANPSQASVARQNGPRARFHRDLQLMKDITPVNAVTGTGYVLLANNKLKGKSVADIVAMPTPR